METNVNPENVQPLKSSPESQGSNNVPISTSSDTKTEGAEVIEKRNKEMYYHFSWARRAFLAGQIDSEMYESYRTQFFESGFVPYKTFDELQQAFERKEFDFPTHSHFKNLLRESESTPKQERQTLDDPKAQAEKITHTTTHQQYKTILELMRAWVAGKISYDEYVKMEKIMPDQEQKTENQSEVTRHEEDEYKIQIRGEYGAVKRKIERLIGGSTSDVYEAEYSSTAEAADHPAVIKVYNQEPFGSLDNRIWVLGPGEGAFLEQMQGVPGIIKVFETGWLDSSNRLHPRLKPGALPSYIGIHDIFPENFAIVMERLDIEKVMMRQEYTRLIKEILYPDEFEYPELDELRSRYNLQGDLKQSLQLAEDFMISAAWVYFNTKAEAQTRGWKYTDNDPSKGFAFDAEKKRWRMFDFGIVDPVGDAAIARVDQYLDEERTRKLVQRRKESEERWSEPVISTPHERIVNEAIRECMAKTLTNSATLHYEDVPLALKKFYTWIQDSGEEIDSYETMRHHIGTYILNQMPEGSIAEKIVDNTNGKAKSLREAA